MNEQLCKDIESVINDVALSEQDRSYTIMERLRRECVFIHNSYFSDFRASEEVTIDPDSPSVKFHLGENDRVEDYVKIYAYSFGPFNPEIYFKEDTLRIVWLLKEPYMGLGDLDKYASGECRYLGGHDQAAEYVHYYSQYANLGRGNETIPRVVEYTKRLLISLGELTEECCTQDVMNHICILEANHFPGLAFNGTKSKDNLIAKWVKINANIISELINFYDPHIIIGCQSFLGAFTPCPEMLNWFSDSNNNENSKYVIGDKIYPNEIGRKKIIKTWGWKNKHSMVKSEDGRYWINAYHPQQSVETNRIILENNLKKFADDIVNDKTSTINRIIKSPAV